jgi:O-Antigen ligase
MCGTSAGAKYNMLNGLQAASRLLIRASLALFTGVVLLLIQSAFWSNRVSAWMQAIIFATALLSYFRPHYGLLALAALVPLGQVGSSTLDSAMRGAEAVVLAFLAGALVRGWTLREFRTFPSTRLHIAALIFGAVVAASSVEQIWFAQIQRDFAWPFAQDLLRYASRNYLTARGGFDMLFRAMLLLEGLALLLYSDRYARQHPHFCQRLIVAIVAGAAATGIVTVWYVAAELVETGAVRARFFEFFAANRWTVHIGDVNAAGSFFAMGMFIAVGMAARKSRYRMAWMVVTLLLASTTFMTHSRMALAAVALTSACLAAAMTIGRIIGVKKTVVITAATAVGLAFALWHYLGPEYFGAGAHNAMATRRLFLVTTWRMLLAEPLFGIGVGQYFLWSRAFAIPEMFEYYQRENAHNNFAQIAGELGVVGLVGFLVVLAVSLWRRGSEGRPDLFIPVMLGLSAFILTWLGGHPLLVPDASYPFWITLGVAGALTVTGTTPRWPAVLVAMCVAILLVSIPFRVASHVSRIDLSRVRYGVSTRQLMTSRSRFFVPAGTAQVALPLRSRTADDDEPVEIDVFIDGSASATITLIDRSWRRTAINLPPDASRRFHEVDLRIRPDDTLDNVEPDRRSVEVGKWEIIAKPNG